MSAGKPLALDLSGLPSGTVRDSGLAHDVSHSQAEHLMHISCHRDIDSIHEIWSAFQERAVGSFYETWAWNSAWQHCIGQAQGVSPRIILGRDQDDRLLFLLPLSVRRRAGCDVLTWLTAPTQNYGFGLYDPGFLADTGGDLSSFWPQIVHAAGPVDAVHLASMPARWLGRPHPLQRLFSVRDANCAYITHLDGDYDAVYARKRSSASRRSAKKRDARLRREGTLTFGLPQTPDEAHQTIKAMFDQHTERLGEMGIMGAFPREQAFVHLLVDQCFCPDDPKTRIPDIGTGSCSNEQLERDAVSKTGHPAPEGLAPYALALDGTLLGVALGGVHGGVYYALILSMTDGQMRKHSPGDAVLRRTIEACTRAGLTTFDFGAGHSEYKDAWADEVIPLHHLLAACSARGLLYFATTYLANGLKRWLKSSRRLWPIVRGLRRRLAGSQSTAS